MAMSAVSAPRGTQRRGRSPQRRDSRQARMSATSVVARRRVGQQDSPTLATTSPWPCQRGRSSHPEVEEFVQHDRPDRSAHAEGCRGNSHALAHAGNRAQASILRQMRECSILSMRSIRARSPVRSAAPPTSSLAQPMYQALADAAPPISASCDAKAERPPPRRRSRLSRSTSPPRQAARNPPRNVSPAPVVLPP